MTKPTIRNLSISSWFQRQVTSTHASDQVNLTVRTGEFVSIVGPSSCGKSTLLHTAFQTSKSLTGVRRFRPACVELPGVLCYASWPC